jgi:hypothetical protein
VKNPAILVNVLIAGLIALTLVLTKDPLALLGIFYFLQPGPSPEMLAMMQGEGEVTDARGPMGFLPPDPEFSDSE